MITCGEELQILEWIGQLNSKLTLIFSSAYDDSPKAFHEACDRRGATVVVAMTVQGCVFGGYTSKSWGQPTQIQGDPEALLFRLRKKGEQHFQTFPVLSGQGNTISHPDSGPVFGDRELCIQNATVMCQPKGIFLKQTTRLSAFEYQQRIGLVLGGAQVVQGFGGGNFCAAGKKQLTEQTAEQLIGHSTSANLIEWHVYKVEDEVETRKVEPILIKPWRKVVKDWNQKALEGAKHEVSTYQPPSATCLEHLNVLLTGPIGAGKSSFINTVNSVYRGYVTSLAAAGRTEHGLTTKFNTLVPVTPETYGFVSSPGWKDKAHVVVLVLRADCVDTMDAALSQKLLTLMKQTHARGLPLAVLLTHIDNILEEPDDLSTVFHSQAVLKAVDGAANILGVPRGHVLPVKNYESETELEDHVDLLALVALRQLLRLADGYFDDQVAVRGLSFPKRVEDKLDQPN